MKLPMLYVLTNHNAWLGYSHVYSLLFSDFSETYDAQILPDSASKILHASDTVFISFHFIIIIFFWKELNINPAS